MPTSIEIRTEDGTCPAYVFEAGGPSVLLYIDGIGMRPAMHELGERLAKEGYRTLMPDLFYRIGPYIAPDPKQLFADPAVRTAWFTRVSSTTKADSMMRDTRAYLDWLGAAKVGVTGYCMGGRMALTAAGHFPDRIAAAAAYHPGQIATEAPDSPHLLAPKIKASVYVGGAMEDVTFPDEHKQRLEAALTAAGVDHVIETYQARHGWVPSDTPVHDAAATERHWQTLLALFARTLR
jgi:carboxymethylenebutenolidase